MSAHRWMKFWPQDWSDDPALRSCSLGAQGLWMRLICLAHVAKPYGHVLIGGKIPTTAQLARVVGGTETEVQSLLDELENQGVFERSRAGGIQSRRMMRDAAASEKGRKSIKKRWSQDTEITEEIETPNRVNDKTHIGTLIVLEAEAEAEKKEPPFQAPLFDAPAPPPPARRTQGSRLPPDWQPDPAGIEHCRNFGLHVAIVLPAFRDFWHSQPGAKGVKLDWAATWRNWCRNDRNARAPLALVASGGRSPHEDHVQGRL